MTDASPLKAAVMEKQKEYNEMKPELTKVLDWQVMFAQEMTIHCFASSAGSVHCFLDGRGGARGAEGDVQTQAFHQASACPSRRKH